MIAVLSLLAEFLFYAYLPEKADNDFDRKGSIRSVFLVGKSGERIEPAEGRRMEAGHPSPVRSRRETTVSLSHPRSSFSG